MTYPHTRRPLALLGVALLLGALLGPAWPATAQPIEDHYFGATLFVAPTGNAVWPPVAVHSLVEYEATYGRIPGPAIDHGYQAAELFFANGGSALYVIDPQGSTVQHFANALAASGNLPVDLVALPGAACCTNAPATHAAIMAALSTHVDASPNRFGLIDAPRDSDVTALVAYRATFTSSHTALYAPWLVVDNTVTNSSATVPPSSAVAGVISRVDRDNGIHKAPAGPDRGHLATSPVTTVEREFSSTDLNPLVAADINPLGPFVAPANIHIWGARTTSTSAEMRYVNVARLLRLLEFSARQSLADIYGTPATAPNPNTVAALLQNYLHDYWLQGALQGQTPTQAYFAQCSLEPATVDCTAGIAPIRPAEFLLFHVSIPWGDLIFASGFEAD